MKAGGDLQKGTMRTIFMTIDITAAEAHALFISANVQAWNYTEVTVIFPAKSTMNRQCVFIFLKIKKPIWEIFFF